jgi:hypothetical protein
VLLRKVPMELGFALGLFAVFGILRYRTEEIRMRDLTYLFIVIGLGILNAVANKSVSFMELILVNGIIAGVTAGLELTAASRAHGSTPMLYDNLALLRPGKHAELLADLSARTGFDVIRVQLHRVDLLRDAAEVTIFYKGAHNCCATSPSRSPRSPVWARRPQRTPTPTSSSGTSWASPPSSPTTPRCRSSSTSASTWTPRGSTRSCRRVACTTN